MSGLAGWMAVRLETQRGRLLLWAPVLLACGIGAYFGLAEEPWIAGWAGLVVLGFAVDRFLSSPWCLLPRAGAVVALGLVIAALRAQALAGPVLEYRFYGPVEGRIVAIDRSASDAVRLTLDRVILGDMPFADTPERVRLSLHGQQGFIAPEPGMVVITTAHLSPPAGPVEPGGYDFRRAAWFDQLGAVGYTRVPVLMLWPPEGGAKLWLTRLRTRFAAAIIANMPKSAGAFAAAIITGDRSAIPAEATEALRRSNLAHLLAISGLHMGLLTGGVFVMLRRLVLAAALAGAGYLVLSGGNVATERAFVMVAIMFGAVFAGTRAISLRAVAVAALLVLLRRPEELLGLGFQMSFAATVALVAGFGALFGAEALGLWVMAIGIDWILAVARVFAELPGAVRYVKAPAPVVLPLFAAGALWWLLWRGRLRHAGVLVVAGAVLIWAQTPRPLVLVSDTGGLIGWLGPEGRGLSKPRGDGFAADIWLENDGAPVPQELAAGRDGLRRDGRRITLDMASGQRIVLVTGKQALAALDGGCGGADVLIANTVDPIPTRPCDRYDAARLWQTGALALFPGAEGVRVITARAMAGRRLWHFDQRDQ